MAVTAKKISDFRKQKGLTQEELAERAQVALRTIQRIENNESEPRGKTLNLICEALEIDFEDLREVEQQSKGNRLAVQIANLLFLVVLNMVLMAIIGYMTLSHDRSFRSILAGVLLSFFIPSFIVFFTSRMSGLERMLKFGTGFMVYFLIVQFKHGFGTGFHTGLYLCLLIALIVLYFGDLIVKLREA